MDVTVLADEAAYGREVSKAKFPATLFAFMVKSVRALAFGLLLLVISGAIFFPCIAALLR